ncbi:iron uptake protein [Variovorax sp. EBFNA2]|uniref:iron uptake protein n=1 Tax=Variovorax sp. EBFNA2 TaxID=3342097 RepID=UPI0029C038DD|nr:iron uptake protein [Variovorax boronicumulans]WPG38898.1 iron uptake protein [Variovorax boronicumulans]
MARSAASAVHVISRIAAGVLGSYVFCWGFIALGVGLLFSAGMPFHDAESLSSMLAFLVFLAAFLWAFAAGSLARVWSVLLGGGLAMTGAASLVQWALL